MKVFFSIPMLLILLVTVLLLSGCVIPGISVSSEEEAKKLADQTVEAKLLIQLEQQFVKVKDCTVEELISTVMAVSPSNATIPPPSAEQKAQIELYIEQFKQCIPVLETTATKQAENQYLVSYKFVSSSGCDSELFSEAQSTVEVEVNTETNTTNVVKGAIPEDQIQNIQTIMQEPGNCMALMVGASSGSL